MTKKEFLIELFKENIKECYPTDYGIETEENSFYVPCISVPVAIPVLTGIEEQDFIQTESAYIGFFEQVINYKISFFITFGSSIFKITKKEYKDLKKMFEQRKIDLKRQEIEERKIRDEEYLEYAFKHKMNKEKRKVLLEKGVENGKQKSIN